MTVGKEVRTLTSLSSWAIIIQKHPEIYAFYSWQTNWDVRFANQTKILRKKIIGITCHNSKKLIRHAIKDGASYIAIGAFFKSKTKKINYIAKPSLISWAKRFTKLPVVIIGGITNKNFRKLLLHKPDFLAISGGIWGKKPTKAIKEFLWK